MREARICSGLNQSTSCKLSMETKNQVTTDEKHGTHNTLARRHYPEHGLALGTLLRLWEFMRRTPPSIEMVSANVKVRVTLV